MITLEDCIAFSGLTEQEVIAIADHEIISEIVANALMQYLQSKDHGSERVRDMIVNDIREARQRNDKGRVQLLLHVLHHYLTEHPEAIPLEHPWSARG